MQLLLIVALVHSRLVCVSRCFVSVVVDSICQIVLIFALLSEILQPIVPFRVISLKFRV